MLKQITLFLACAGAALGLYSCTESDFSSIESPRPAPPPLAYEPIGVQVVRAQPSLAGMPFRVLLDFEKDVDLAFVTAPHARRDSTTAHTGRASLLLPPQSLRVKLGSLLGEGKFPGTWTLLGGYFRSSQPVTLTLACRSADGGNGAAGAVLGQRSVPIAPGKWVPVFLDLPATTAPLAAPPLLGITIAGTGNVWCDDLLLINNERVYETPAQGGDPAAGWTIRQRGFAVTIERPQRFKLTLKTPEAAADGWNCEEANEIRARLISASGKVWVVYSDGRQYQDGKASLLFNPNGAAGAQAFAEQHASPAQVEVPQEQGSLERNTTGDQNNDGYNELRGAYQIQASGPRMEVKLTPQSTPAIHPVLEIARLPAGKVVVNVEGQWVTRTARLADGTVLVELPMTLSRAVTASIAVK